MEAIDRETCKSQRPGFPPVPRLGNSIKRDDAPVNNREDYKLKRDKELTNVADRSGSVFLGTR